MTTLSAVENVGADMYESLEAEQGDLVLLDHPVARELLQSARPARLAYIARDGTPRVVPLVFHWTGEEIIVSSWPDDPKVAALREHPAVALTVDTDAPPFRVLSIRGTAVVTLVDGMPDESLPTFTRYFGAAQARAQIEQMERMSDRSARIAIRPNWVGVLDFETRFPSGMTRRMGGPRA
jgi:PPOX class probable F420-dependent enzyme